MGKIAFLFAGQGAQYPGMGRSLYDASPCAREVFALMEAAKPDLKELCFNSGEENLKITLHTQPCVFAVDLMAAAALAEKGVLPDGVAGFSLGEAAALTYAKVFDPAKGMAIVCERAKFMNKAAAENPGKMVAVLKMSDLDVERVCREFDKAYPVNYNCDGQLVAACSEEETEAFAQRIKEEGGRARILPVSGGFHSPFMDSAARDFGKLLDETELASPVLDVFSNFNAQPYGKSEEEIRKTLTRQINSPVRWSQTLKNMAEQGYDTFIEVGPGKVLSGLCKYSGIEGIEILNVQDEESLKSTLDAIKI